MRQESEPGDVVEMDAWLREALLQRLTALEATIEGPAKAEVHDMRNELEARLYREHLKRDSSFRNHAQSVKERLASGALKRTTVDQFREWAEGIRPTQ